MQVYFIVVNSGLVGMRLKTLENQMRVYMSPDDYQVMLDSAENRRAKMAMRCMGEMGLRVGELDFAWQRIRKSTNSDVEIWFLPIYGKDSKSRDTDGKRRDVWVPEDLKDTLEEYKRINNLSDDTSLFPVSTRTIQRDIENSADNAARKTGNDDFEFVTCHDFRAYFATNMALREGVDIETVMELGGWEDRNTMDPYLNASFDDIIQADLAAAGVLSADVETEPSELEVVLNELIALREAVNQIDPKVSVEGPSDDSQRGLTDFNS